MGIFDFVKTAGEKLLGLGSKNPVAAPQAGAVIAQHVKKQGLGVKDDLEIIWIDGKAKVSGTAPPRPTRKRPSSPSATSKASPRSKTTSRSAKPHRPRNRACTR
jgi:hypothetical protein